MEVALTAPTMAENPVALATRASVAMPDVHNTADRSRRQRHYKRTSGNALGRSNSVIASGAISSLFKQPTPPPEGSGRIWLAVKRAQCMLRNPQLVVPAKKALPDARTRIEGPCQTIGINTIAQIAKRPPTRIFPCDAFKTVPASHPLQLQYAKTAREHHFAAKCLNVVPQRVRTDVVR